MGGSARRALKVREWQSRPGSGFGDQRRDAAATMGVRGELKVREWQSAALVLGISGGTPLHDGGSARRALKVREWQSRPGSGFGDQRRDAAATMGGVRGEP